MEFLLWQFILNLLSKKLSLKELSACAMRFSPDYGIKDMKGDFMAILHTHPTTIKLEQGLPDLGFEWHDPTGLLGALRQSQTH